MFPSLQSPTFWEALGAHFVQREESLHPGHHRGLGPARGGRRLPGDAVPGDAGWSGGLHPNSTRARETQRVNVFVAKNKKGIVLP